MARRRDSVRENGRTRVNSSAVTFSGRRTRLLTRLWPSFTTYAALGGASTITTNVAADPYQPSSAVRTDIWRINMTIPPANTVYAEPRLWYPATPVSPARVIHLHQGHDDGFTNGDLAVTANHFLDLGYYVIGHGMPLQNPNPKTWNLTLSTGAFTWNAHSLHDHGTGVPNLVAAGVMPWPLYLEPVIRATTQAMTTLGVTDRIYMTGLSGGGWTTAWIAALDTRIAASYAIAGSFPHQYHDDPGLDFGDWEQKPTRTELAIANELVGLYAMGASGGRRCVQGLNEADNGAFPAAGRHSEIDTYEAEVTRRLAAGGDTGTFEVWIDLASVVHSISAWMRGQISADITARFP